MEKEPANRYSTAQELADDLRRFQLDRPILARRVGKLERAWRWCRRNRAVATLLAASLVLAAGLAALALLLWDKEKQTEAALKQADDRREIAESNFRRACVLLHDAPLKHQLEWARRQTTNARFLSEGLSRSQDRTLAVFQRLLTEPGPDPGDRLLTAEVHRELADIHSALERRSEGVHEYQEAIVVLRPLAAEFPHEAGFRDSLAHCLKQKAVQLADLRKQRFTDPDPFPTEDFSKDYLEAIAIYEGLRQEFQDVPWYRVQLADCWCGLAGGYRNSYRRIGLFDQAEQALLRALALDESLLDEFPQSPEERSRVVAIHDSLAWILLIRPDWNAAGAAEAFDHVQKAMKLSGSDHNLWHTLGVAHCRLRHWKQALECFEKSRQLEGKPGPPDAYEAFSWRWPTTGSATRTKRGAAMTRGCSGWKSMNPTTATCASSGARPRRCWAFESKRTSHR
jgi:tetratricopeptide (TPR) repeat protein